MKEINISDRLTFLAESFDIFECTVDKITKDSEIEIKTQALISEGFTPSLIKTPNQTIIAILSVKINEKERKLKKVSICSDVFAAMIAADPTENKMYLQWMLNLFSRLIKEGSEISITTAIRLVEEDLPQANAYLQLFEDNKRKKTFKDLCQASYVLKHVADPTNINQYMSLSQLFDAVDPFIEKEPSAVERILNKFVDSGQATIPVKDRKFTLYIPKTTAASVVFNNFANWCTAKKDNGMFNSYTEGHKKPNGKNSDIYIIINNKFFTGQSQELYQIHFETKQLKDKGNSQNVSIFEQVINESEGLANYFHDELIIMAKGFKKGIKENMYLDYLIQFGFAESLFELLDTDTPTIKYMDREIPRLPDLSRFKMVDQIVITHANMVELHPSIGKLVNLEMISLTGNRLKSLPKEIGNLKKVEFINVCENPITEIPSEIAYLDKSRGGSLLRLGIDKDKIGKDLYRRLKELLPTTTIG